MPVRAIADRIGIFFIQPSHHNVPQRGFLKESAIRFMPRLSESHPFVGDGKNLFPNPSARNIGKSRIQVERPAFRIPLHAKRAPIEGLEIIVELQKAVDGWRVVGRHLKLLGFDDVV